MDNDEAEIRRLIEAQFTSLSWDEENRADWSTFASGFHKDASMYPARRPAQPQSVDAFRERLDGLRRDGTLATFSEAGNGIAVMSVGSVAVALAGCEMTENSSHVSRDVSAFLLVKEEEGWRIAAQAWDLVDAFEALHRYTRILGETKSEFT